MSGPDPTRRPTGKDLAERYKGNRGYLRRFGGPTFLRTALAVVAGLAVGVWAVAEVVSPGRTAPAHTHGPLTSPHAAWDADCAACHKPHSLSKDGVFSVLNVRDRWHDLSCERCHAGPAHHTAMTDTAKAFHDRCSNCHHDHQGRANSLVRIADSHCTHCHGNLPAHHAAGAPAAAASVTSFATNHPEFRPLTKVPERKLKFSHPLHMTAGVARSADDKTAVTVDRLKELAGKGAQGEAAAARYAPGKGGGELVQLDCKSCHQLDAGAGPPRADGHQFAENKAALDRFGEPVRSVLPPRGEGAHFLPVNFEAHCRVCHPIRAGEGVTGQEVVAGFDLPHRRQPAEMAKEVEAGYLRGLAAGKHPAFAEPLGPGGPLDKRTDPVRTLREETARMTERTRPALLYSERGGCVECHVVHKAEAWADRIEPVPDRTVWFPGAYFNHAAHRSTDCATCHPASYGAHVKPGVLDRDVQILGIDSCRACHAPAGTKVRLKPDGPEVGGGGVRHNCTDCHRYHNGDHALQGRGAWANFPAKPLALDQFLPGNPKKD